MRFAAITGIFTAFFDFGGKIFAPTEVETRRFEPIVESIVRRARYVDCVNAHIRYGFCVFHALFDGVALAGFADFVVELVDGKTNDDGIITALFADTLYNLSYKAQAVFKTSAVFVRTMIGVGTEKLLNKISVRTVKFHPVNARLFATHRTVDKLSYKFFDFALS